MLFLINSGTTIRYRTLVLIRYTLGYVTLYIYYVHCCTVCTYVLVVLELFGSSTLAQLNNFLYFNLKISETMV